MVQHITFTAKIEKVPTVGGWHLVRLPDEVLKELRSATGKNGNVPVLVKIGKTGWPSTTMSMGAQQWFVAVKADVRKKESIAEGDTVSVKIAPDFDRLMQP